MRPVDRGGVGIKKNDGGDEFSYDILSKLL
jgi:hypothetical protein